MANEKVSAMSTAGALTGSELVPLIQSGANVATTAQDIADLAPGAGGDLPVYTAPATVGVTITAGQSDAVDPGGDLTLNAGPAADATPGGAVRINGGISGEGDGGAVIITAGDGGEGAGDDGGVINLIAGNAVSGANGNGGSINLIVGTDVGSGVAGYVNAGGRVTMAALPTSAAGLPSGAIWSNLGILTVV